MELANGIHTANEDTIFAPSSAIGGAIVVIRISGSDAKRVGSLLDRDIVAQAGRLVHVCVSQDGALLDESMAVYFRAPHSYTGEDMVELNCHGGRRTVQRILGALSLLGFRPAEGGEFTKRAFLNGKMDLSAAEAVMDVINADAEQSLKAALLQLRGSVKREVDALEALLLDALSGVDAAIDYPDEVEADILEALPKLLSAAQARLDALIGDSRRGRTLRDGLRVAIVGRPNVGKSSLMNVLLGEERAIVTAQAGTTRDVLDERLSLGGVPVRLIDTAGIRVAGDEAERIGVTRALDALENADVVCLVLDASEPLTAEDERLLNETSNRLRVVALNKSDLGRRAELTGDAIHISARTGEGVPALIEHILALAAPERDDGAYITNERHIRALELAREAVCAAQTACELDCAATDVREALHRLGSITGTQIDAAVIDRIFERFCVGK